jgi:circadian clock protein KaiA
LYSRLSLCIFAFSEQITQYLTKLLSNDRYVLNQVPSSLDFLDFIEQHKEQLDCLIFLDDPSSRPLLSQLQEQGILLPTIIIDQGNLSELKKEQNQTNEPNYIYHTAEIRILASELDNIPLAIDQALGQFLHLAPSCALSERENKLKLAKEENKQAFLMLQQRRLAEKLKERLGYLGIYYKRNPRHFYRNLPKEEKKEFLEQLSLEYRQVILNYFSSNEQINQEIDQFVNRAFFADLSVSQILEIHMELMDEFAQQLKLEGRNEEILLDYRLALIDMIAHLCEMYRRSIPREDLPFELLFQID